MPHSLDTGGFPDHVGYCAYEHGSECEGSDRALRGEASNLRIASVMVQTLIMPSFRKGRLIKPTHYAF